MEAAAIGEPGSRGVQKRAFTAQGFRSRVLEAAPEARSKEAVVFIHGAPGSAGDWYPLLSEVGAFARALAFDLPGFGSADKPARWDYSPDSFATFVAAALAELRVDRAHLVMSDLGGLAGLHWAAAHQHAFASAVLINTGVLIGYRWHLLGRLHRMPLVGTAVAAGGRVGLRAALRVYGTRLRKETQTRWTGASTGDRAGRCCASIGPRPRRRCRAWRRRWRGSIDPRSCCGASGTGSSPPNSRSASASRSRVRRSRSSKASATTATSRRLHGSASESFPSSGVSSGWSRWAPGRRRG